VVGGGHHAHVHFSRSGFTEPSDFLLLQYAKQVGLDVVGDIADLVEEQDSALRGLEEPLLVVDGSGEGAFLVAEELAAQQRIREPGAVGCNEGAFMPYARLM
jgi:hypothetical protein